DACLRTGPRLALEQFIAPPDQGIELGFLVGDTLRVQLFDRGTGIGGGLLGQFGEVFPDGGDALLDLGKRQRNVRHGSSPRHACFSEYGASAGSNKAVFGSPAGKAAARRITAGA